MALANLEAGKSLQFSWFYVKAVDMRQWRRVLLQVLHKSNTVSGAATDFDFYAVRGIKHPTCEGVFLG